MNKFWIQCVALLLLSFLGLFLTFGGDYLGFIQPAASPFDGSKSAPIIKRKLQVGTVLLNVDVAESAASRATGLSGRETLAADSGMLFVFPEAKKYRFWMKGMLIPLDFIWINNGKVVDIIENVPAPLAGQTDDSLPVYEPVLAVSQLLEVNAGFVKTNGIKVGDPVELRVQ